MEVLDPVLNDIDWDTLSPPCDRDGYKVSGAPLCKGDPAAFVVVWGGPCDCFANEQWLYCDHCAHLDGPCGRCGVYGKMKILGPL